METEGAVGRALFLTPCLKYPPRPPSRSGPSSNAPALCGVPALLCSQWSAQPRDSDGLLAPSPPWTRCGAMRHYLFAPHRAYSVSLPLFKSFSRSVYNPLGLLPRLPEGRWVFLCGCLRAGSQGFLVGNCFRDLYAWLFRSPFHPNVVNFRTATCKFPPESTLTPR